MAAKDSVPVDEVLEFLKDRTCPDTLKVLRHLNILKTYYANIDTCDVIPVPIGDEIVYVSFGARDYCLTCKSRLQEIQGFSDIYYVCPKCEG